MSVFNVFSFISDQQESYHHNIFNNNNKHFSSSIFLDEINHLLDNDDNVIIELHFYEDDVTDLSPDSNGEWSCNLKKIFFFLNFFLALTKV